MIAFGVFKKIVAYFMALATTFNITLGTTIGTTQGESIMATRRSYRFDNSGLLIGGYIFDLRYADATHVSYVKEAGIDFLITGVNDTFLDLCEQYGIGVIANTYNARRMGREATGSDEWFSITAATLKDHPALWGEDLLDEPSSVGFAKLGEVANYYNTVAPGKIAYINLFPMYANEEQLGNPSEIPLYKQILLPNTDFSSKSIDSYKKHVSDYINNIDTDYISVDIYPLGVKKDESGKTIKTTSSKWLRNLDILSEACRKTNRDLWVITQSTGNNKVEGGTSRYCDTPEDIRWQAFVSLAFGTKAIIHACYNGGWSDTDSHPIDEAGNRTATYYAVQTVDNELKMFADIYGNYKNLGAYLVNGKKATGTQYGFLMPVDNAAKPKVTSTSPLLVGCFEGKNSASKAFTVVNMNEPQNGLGATAKLCFADATKITVYKKGVATVINADTCNLSLDTCEGVFITVE